MCLHEQRLKKKTVITYLPNISQNYTLPIFENLDSISELYSL